MSDYNNRENAIADATRAELKPVVQCRECKRWGTGNITGSFPDGVQCFCAELSGGLMRRYTAPDDFCCWGERKEETERG